MFIKEIITFYEIHGFFPHEAVKLNPQQVRKEPTIPPVETNEVLENYLNGLSQPANK
jgi:hypothetical protein